MRSELRLFFILLCAGSLFLSTRASSESGRGNIGFVARVLSMRVIGSGIGDVAPPKIVLVKLESENFIGRKKVTLVTRLSMIDTLHPKRIFVVLNNVLQKEVIFWSPVSDNICATTADLEKFQLDQYAADVDVLTDDEHKALHYQCFEISERR